MVKYAKHKCKILGCKSEGSLFCFCSELEYLEEDSLFFENQKEASSSISYAAVPSVQWLQSDLDQIIEYDAECIASESDQNAKDICTKCMQLDMELQKLRGLVSKLQKRCVDKSSEKRAKMAKKSLEEILKEIKEKKWVSEEGQAVLNSFDQDILNCLESGRPQKKYSARIRTFALTLHFYSPRGYRYVRSVFNNNLPSISTIRKWYSTIDGKPGFSSEAFTALKCKALEANQNVEEILAYLIFDEVAIRQQMDYDQHSDRKVGMVNYGTEDDEKNFAKEELVFMVPGIKEAFKTPVAYFLIAGLNASEKAALLAHILLMIDKTGVKIVGLTYDGLSTNRSMAKELGADFLNNKPYILNPHSNDKIFLFPDACHFLKTVRNRLAFKAILYDKDNRKIEWRFIEELEIFQRENNVNLGNKITKVHIQWSKVKMNVCVAAQTLSNSVADAIEFLRIKGFEKFQESEATVEFIRRFNNIFDILNSKRDKDAIGFKRVISEETKLKLSPQGKSIIKTKSKTAFLNFITTMINFRSFYETNVQDGVRQMFGCNDNPSARQLESAWRKLLGHNHVRASDAANCQNNNFQYLTVLNASSRKQKNIRDSNEESSEIEEESEQTVNHIDEWEINEGLLMDNNNEFLSEIKQHVVCYVASIIEKCIVEGRWYAPIKFV
ncbi:uncharacterized protein LOC116350533 [Contarinia nasturtii]|uniref:uncharacterized protein LOC116350533 n=1 Tax=Contarinia nasturtii TaxID=265458 RepID=UPI0012D4330B|nr:uncharacterized protein LOC116350533 [Contarinia nasturtii]